MRGGSYGGAFVFIMIEYFNATKVLRYSNEKRGDKIKRLRDFWENSYVQEHLSNLESRGISEPYKTKRGRGGCTMMRNELFPLFLNWISPELLFDYKNKYPIEYDNYLKSMEVTETTTHKKKEYDFFNVLNSLVYPDNVRIHNQYLVGNYYIDFMVETLSADFGDSYTIIEFDESYHNGERQSEKDKKRIDDITKELMNNRNTSSIVLVRVPYDKIGYAYTYLIPYISCVETSYCSGKIQEYLHYEILYDEYL